MSSGVGHSPSVAARPALRAALWPPWRGRRFLCAGLATPLPSRPSRMRSPTRTLASTRSQARAGPIRTHPSWPDVTLSASAHEGTAFDLVEGAFCCRTVVEASPSDRGRQPGEVVAHEHVQVDEQLAHAGHQGHLRLLSLLDEVLPRSATSSSRGSHSGLSPTATSAMRASTAASMASVLARLPRPRAKCRARAGSTSTTGKPAACSAVSVRRSYPPEATSTTRRAATPASAPASSRTA